MATPCVVDTVIGTYGVEPAAISDIHHEVEVMGPHTGQHVLSGGVQDEVVVDLEAMTTGQESEGPLCVLSFTEVAEFLEGGGSDGGVVEQCDVVVSGHIHAMVIDRGLDLTLVRSVVGGEANRDVRGVIGPVMVSVVGKRVIPVRATSTMKRSSSMKSGSAPAKW